MQNGTLEADKEGAVVNIELIEKSEDVPLEELNLPVDLVQESTRCQADDDTTA